MLIKPTATSFFQEPFKKEYLTHAEFLRNNAQVKKFETLKLRQKKEKFFKSKHQFFIDSYRRTRMPYV